MDYSLLLSIMGYAMVGVGAFFHTKYQSESNKQKIKDIEDSYKKEVEELKKENDLLSKRVEASFKKLDTHGEDIRGLQTEKEQFLTAKDADDIYLRIKEFDRFEKHIDKRFDTLEQGMGKLLNKIDQLTI